MTEKILKQNFEKTRNTLLEMSKHFDIAQHGVIKGNVREGLVNEFLQKCLPSNVDYLTGEIVDKNNKPSGQIDIILQSKNEPRIQLYQSQHIALADSVIGVIEVKSTLTTGTPNGKNAFSQAFETIKKVKELDREFSTKTNLKDGNILNIFEIPCILFAYNGPKLETLKNAIRKYSDYYNYEQKDWLKYFPEVIVVLNQGYYLYKVDGVIFANEEKHHVGKTGYNDKQEETLIGMFKYLCDLIIDRNLSIFRSNYTDYLK